MKVTPGAKFAPDAAALDWPQCLFCRHWVRGSCPAFPGGVPGAITANVFDHRRPYPGQADPAVLFDPRPDADAGAVRRLTAVLDAL